MQKEKLKKKIVLVLAAAALVLVLAFFISGYVYFIGFENTFRGLRYRQFFTSLFINEPHRRLFLAGFLIGLMGIGILVMKDFGNEYRSDKKKVTDDLYIPEQAGQLQYGSARFMDKDEKGKAFETTILPQDYRNKEELLQAKGRLKRGGIIVGYEKEKAFRKPFQEKVYFVSDDVHSLIMGATRSGKTRGLILQSVCFLGLSGESIIISDPKGEIFDYTEPYLKEMGYEVLTLNFRKPKKSHRYNFLQPIIDAMNEGDIPKAIDRTWDFASAIVPEAKEKIWENGEKSIMAGAVLSVVFDNKEHPDCQNLSTVYSFINKMSGINPFTDEMYLKSYVDSLEDAHPAKEIYGVAINAPSKQRMSFITSALSTLNLFTNPNIRDMTKRSDFSLKETGNRKRALFIILPDEKNTFNTLASIFVEQQYTALVEQADERGGRLKNRCNFLLDEFGNFTKIPNFLNFLTVGGGRGIRFNLVIQSFAQLQDKYGNHAANGIKGNCHILVYLASSEKETRNEISQMLGKYTVASYGKSSQRNGQGTANRNQSLAGRELLTSDEVGLIQRPYVLILYQGRRPAMMRIPDMSQWRFNEWLGMGDFDFNTELRAKRQAAHIDRTDEPFVPCKTWDRIFAGEIMPEVSSVMEGIEGMMEETVEYDDTPDAMYE